MSSLKDQLGVIIKYLMKKGPGNVASHKSQHSSVSTIVAKMLDEWKRMPESERKIYEEMYMKEGLDSKTDKWADKT